MIFLVWVTFICQWSNRKAVCETWGSDSCVALLERTDLLWHTDPSVHIQVYTLSINVVVETTTIHHPIQILVAMETESRSTTKQLNLYSDFLVMLTTQNALHWRHTYSIKLTKQTYTCTQVGVKCFDKSHIDKSLLELSPTLWVQDDYSHHWATVLAWSLWQVFLMSKAFTGSAAFYCLIFKKPLSV